MCDTMNIFNYIFIKNGVLQHLNNNVRIQDNIYSQDLTERKMSTYNWLTWRIILYNDMECHLIFKKRHDANQKNNYTMRINFLNQITSKIFWMKWLESTFII